MLLDKNIQSAKRRINIYSYLLQKRLRRQLLGRLTRRPAVQVIKVTEDQDYDSHIIDDLPLTINRDPRPGIRQESPSL